MLPHKDQILISKVDIRRLPRIKLHLKQETIPNIAGDFASCIERDLCDSACLAMPSVIRAHFHVQVQLHPATDLLTTCSAKQNLNYSRGRNRWGSDTIGVLHIRRATPLN